MLNNCEAKGLGCVLTLPIYRGREQHGNGREAGDKGTGSGRVRYGRREVLTPLSLPTQSSIEKGICRYFDRLSIKLRSTIVCVSPASLTDYQSIVGREIDRLSISGYVSAVYR